MKVRQMVLAASLAGVVLTPLAGAGGQMIFEEYFTHQLERWDVMTCCWQVKGYEDGLLLRQKSIDQKLQNTRIVIAERSFENCTIETKLRFGTNPSMSLTPRDIERLGAGIVFGYQDESNYYLYRLAGDSRVVVGKVAEGTWVSLGEKAVRKPTSPMVDEVENSPWYTLKVSVKSGGQIVCELDGSTVFSVDGGQKWGAGKVGLTTFRSMADFAFVKIWAAD